MMEKTLRKRVLKYCGKPTNGILWNAWAHGLISLIRNAKLDNKVNKIKDEK